MLKKMKFFHQILIITLVVFLASSIAIYMITINNLERYSENVESAIKSEIIGTSSRLLSTKAELLGNLSLSSSYWTELVKYSNAKDSEWIKENATEYLMTDPLYNINSLYLYNSHNGYEEHYGEVPIEIYKNIYKSIGDDKYSKKYGSYLLNYNSKVYLISISSLAENDGGNPQGIFMLTQRFDPVIVHDLKELFSKRADLKISVLPSKKFSYFVIEPKTIDNTLNMNIKIDVSDIVLIKSISNETNLLMLIFFLIAFPAVFLLLIFLYNISLNISESIEGIKQITFHDYSKKIHFEFSKEFYELGECINNLSSGLENRDKELEKKYIDIITIMVKTLEEVDIYTKGHSERVSHYAVELAKAVNYHDIELIRISGLLHDIGKVTIDSSILNKPGKLTDEEFDLIRKHPEIAFNILGISDIFAKAKNIVKYHHEKYNGSGYPDGLEGVSIPLGARIIAVADVFDALTSARSYHAPVTAEHAINIIIKDAGKHFDPELVNAFAPIALKVYRAYSYLNESPRADELQTINNNRPST